MQNMVEVKEVGLIFPIRKISFKLVDGINDTLADQISDDLEKDGADTDVSKAVLFFEGQPKILEMWIYHNDTKIHMSRVKPKCQIKS